MKSWIDRTSSQPTAGGLELGTGTGPYGDCRSTQCCVAVWSRWLESATRRVGFRALKKTLEALYTTKVNNRVHTTRGTTQMYYPPLLTVYPASTVSASRSQVTGHTGAAHRPTRCASDIRMADEVD